MKKRNMNEWFKGKGFYILLMAGAICVVAVAAIALDSFGINKNMSGEKNNNDIAQNIVDKPSEPDTEEYAGIDDMNQYRYENLTPAPVPTEVAENTPASTEKPKDEVKEKKDKDKADKKTDADKKTEQKEEAQNVAVMNSGTDVASLEFDQEAGIAWPTQGEVIMKYSVDNVVYHKTLGQYKSNPAIIISADEGSNVSCSVDCVVTKIGQNEEVGNYIETSIGNEYKIMYGGLDNIQVKKGEALKKGEIMGSVAAPTKYYVDEGSNVYLKMTCKNETVDPMIFLE